MREHYMHQATRSIISLSPPTYSTHPGWTICRVSVLPQHRGQGHASQLMRDVTADADRDGVTLYLDIQPDHSPESLSFEELYKFYARNGFKAWGHYPTMRRCVEELYELAPWGITLRTHP